MLRVSVSVKEHMREGGCVCESECECVSVSAVWV